MSECDPLSVILVKSGSKGDKLLFRYPYQIEKKPSTTTKRGRSSYSLPREEVVEENPYYPSHNKCSEHLVGYSDKILASIFGVKSELCGQKFELKINTLRFVGHPVLLEKGTYKETSPKRDISTIILFNIVFALKANASASVITSYHNLSKLLAIAIRHEEKRCRYFSKEAKIMLGIHDEVASLPEDSAESPFHLMLSKIQLARDLKTVFDDLCTSGVVHLYINRWIEINFCLPHKIQNLHNKELWIEPEAIQKCLAALRPYHAILLLQDANELLESLKPDSSPSLVRLIREASPLKQLQQLVSDTDLTLSQVFQLVRHLVYWAKAIIIYPLCESNVYVLAPNATTNVNSPLVEKFVENFPGMSLPAILSEFSLPISLGNQRNPLASTKQQEQQVQMVVWMLQHRLLMQLHTYIFLMPTPQGCSILMDKGREYSGQSTPDDSANLIRHPSLSDVASVASDESSPSFSMLSSRASDTSDGSLLEAARLQCRLQDLILSDLTHAEREAVMQVPAASNPEDLRLFARLARYFRGKHHLEEIMYYENVRRSQLLTLIDKFRSVLITCTHEDAAAASFYRKD